MFTRLVRRPFAALAIALPLAAGASAEAFAKPLVLEDFFRGTTIGKGVFESKIAKVYRPFTVKLTGTWNPHTFTLRLREDFFYEDGERDTKTWFFQKVAEDRYIGQRADVRGPAIVRRDGDGALRFTYVADVETSDGSIALRFNDTLEQVDARTVRNRADVVKLGFPVGTVELTFTK